MVLFEEKQSMSLEVKSGSSSSGSSTSSSTSGSSSSSSSTSGSSSSEDETEENLTEETKCQLLQAKHQYRELKMKLLQSIKENEVLTDELRRHQKKLLRLNRDKYFLFERLLAYEKPPPKQATLKEETIEIIDGVPKVVRVGKKRGPKPKKRDKSPDQDEFGSQQNLGSYGQLMEPGQSLLKLKPIKGSGEGRKRSSKKKERIEAAEQITDSPPPLSSQQGTVSSSSSSVTFSPGFSKDKVMSSLKQRQLQQQPQKVVKSQKMSMNSASTMHQSFLPSSEIPNGSDDDAIMTFESETVPNDPVGAPMNQSEFFRHDSFSNEMPDNLFDD